MSLPDRLYRYLHISPKVATAFESNNYINISVMFIRQSTSCWQTLLPPEDTDPSISPSQLFQSFFLLRTLQLKDWICLGANSSEIHNKVGSERWGYYYNFSSIHGMDTRLSIGRHQHKDLKWTELCLGPIQRRLEAFLGFLVKIKMKAENWLL